MAFGDRNRIYLIGYGGVILATTLGIVGLGAPGWLIASDGDTQEFSGLWQACLHTPGNFHCEYIDYSSFDDYWKATQAMACIGVALLLVSTLFGLCVNLLSTNLPSSPLLEITAFLGGLFLLIGCMVWVGYKQKYDLPFLSLGYAMILATIGSVLAILASVCVSVGSRRLSSYQVLP